METCKWTGRYRLVAANFTRKIGRLVRLISAVDKAYALVRAPHGALAQ